MARHRGHWEGLILLQVVNDAYTVWWTPALRGGRAYGVRRRLWVVIIRRGRLGELWLGLQAECVPSMTHITK